jgi:hypothetical protein
MRKRNSLRLMTESSQRRKRIFVPSSKELTEKMGAQLREAGEASARVGQVRDLEQVTKFMIYIKEVEEMI